MSEEDRTNEHQWVSVNDQLPSPVTKDGYYHDVLVSDWRGQLATGRYVGGTVWIIPGLTCEPTHWREPPLPPERPARAVLFADGHCNKCGSTEKVFTVELVNRGGVRRNVCEDCQSDRNRNSFREWLEYTLSDDED